ncbi:hypothetical protein MNB_SV-12-585 [hydrothermal vent metagenome]|uniref:Uncharacterized protein n=1 Tax=hydrothermal vent metagenome TaxID=652676 RepID=A0A1W1BQF7_9ZZZZ
MVKTPTPQTIVEDITQRILPCDIYHKGGRATIDNTSAMRDESKYLIDFSRFTL